MAAPAHQPRYDLEDPGFPGPRSARETREAARAARNGSSPRYRRPQSPEADDYRFPVTEEGMRSPTSDVALQDAMLAQAQQQQVSAGLTHSLRVIILPPTNFIVQQRVVPVGQQQSQMGRNGGQRRQPPTNNAPSRGPSQQMPPSYNGGTMENGPQQQQGPREGGRYRRQSRRTSESEQSRQATGESPARAAPNTQQNRMSQAEATALQHQQQQQQRRAPSPDRLAVPGTDISRLNSPSIQKSVLLPLEQKIQEYDHLMHDAQSQMTQLDEELRALQERRRMAEERFVDAKTKHDEYERQHQDVGRALRGELVREQPPPPVRQPVQRMDSVDSFEPRPVSEQSSFHHKPKGRGMLRMSLFNKSS
ncbi:hypothetical protein FZEAL_2165 [Fusarium zealandicum]|uniref:Uncharacterized protein n=1 Tax=Fusarium zealandicum TaxID=1053134 RepID=A0A8H4US15_9HYPO|nr:hypothetical protein FZEAL_2165 [Fusarium zealandicum]